MKVLCIQSPAFKNNQPVPCGDKVPIEGETYLVVDEGTWMGKTKLQQLVNNPPPSIFFYDHKIVLWYDEIKREISKLQ